MEGHDGAFALFNFGIRAHAIVGWDYVLHLQGVFGTGE